MPKQPYEYWRDICTTNGVDVSKLTRQDVEVKALRLLGLNGTLLDMRAAFYRGRNPAYSYVTDAIYHNDPNQP